MGPMIFAGSAGSSHLSAVRAVVRKRFATFSSKPSRLDCAATGAIAGNTQLSAHTAQNGSSVFMNELLRLAQTIDTPAHVQDALTASIGRRLATVPWSCRRIE